MWHIHINQKFQFYLTKKVVVLFGYAIFYPRGLTCYVFFPCISLTPCLVREKEKARFPLLWGTCVNVFLSVAHTCWTQWSRPTPRLRRGRGSRAWKHSSSPHTSILNPISSGLLRMLHIHPQHIHTSMQNRMTYMLL